MVKSENKPRIICVGFNIESEITLKGLIENDVNVIALITLPKNVSQNASDYIDLQPLCFDHNIEVIETRDINNDNVYRRLKKLIPDYIFVLGWSQLLKENILSIPNGFVVGSHPSLLPEGRGRAPIAWTILEELKKSAVTLFKMDKGIDSGEILIQKKFDIKPNVNASILYEIIAENLKNAFCDLYEKILLGETVFLEQNIKNASYRSKRTLSDGWIDFHNNAYEIDKLIRAVTYPYPGAYSYYNDNRVHIFKSSLDKILPFTGLPGQIMHVDDSGVLVQAGDRPIWLKNLKTDGKEVSTKNFKIGSKFGYNIEDEIFSLKKKIKKLKI